MIEIIQIANLTEGTERNNPNTFRLYNPIGLSPTINCSGGGNREPLVITSNERVYEESDDDALSAWLEQGGVEITDISPSITKASFENNHFISIQKHQKMKSSMIKLMYRTCKIFLSKERTQDECMKIFKIVFPELNKLNKEEQLENPASIPQKTKDRLVSLAKSWNLNGKMGEWVDEYVWRVLNCTWNVEELRRFYIRITPVVFRIRKLTPRETGRLMGMRDNEIDKFFKAGISNSNIYKLHGNSIVVDTIFHIYRKLLIEQEQDKVKYQQLSLF